MKNLFKKTITLYKNSMTEIIWKKPSELSHYERNPRKITTDQFAKLCDNIQADPKFLECRPLLVNSSSSKLTVYAGNQRLRAAKKLKMKLVPCIIEEDLDEATMKKRIVLDNLTHGEFDFDMLSSDYDPVDLLEMGMTESNLHIDLDDEKEEKTKKPKVCPHCGERL